jgi:acyl carrier protein
MTTDQIKDLVLRAIGEIAPEADLEDIDPDDELREQLDIDSMDFLNIVTAIHEETGIDIPEADYPKIVSLNQCIVYLQAKTS